MTASGIPYRLIGGIRFWERQEIKDLVAYLRLVQNPFDSVSLQRVINVPGRKIGDKTVAKLSAWARERGVPLYTALQMVAGGTDDSPALQAEFTTQARVALVRFVAMLNDLIDEAPGLTPPQLLQQVIDRTGYRSYLKE